MQTTQVDQFVGRKVKYLRMAMGITTRSFADRLGVSEGTVTEFEEGRKRIGASTLYEASRALETHVAYFFEGYQPS